MSQSNWYHGSAQPLRQGFFAAQFSSGETEVTMYSVLGWMPQALRGEVVRWRFLDPAIEQAAVERYLQLRSESRPQAG